MKAGICLLKDESVQAIEMEKQRRVQDRVALSHLRKLLTLRVLS